MIEGLERVAWAELSHAYGSAGDVPDLLRRMAGTDETDVIAAQEELRGRILHQGSVCTATAPTVPFLGALLADPATVHPGGIAHLLGDMADFRDPDLADLAADLRSPDLADLRNPDDPNLAHLHNPNLAHPRNPDDPDLAADLRNPDLAHLHNPDDPNLAHLHNPNLAHPRDPDLAGLRDAVTAQVDRLLPLLSAADAYTRQVTAFALAQCPGRAPEIIPALRERWVIEPEPAVRGSVVIAIVMLDPGTDLLREALAEYQPSGVRAGAAIAAGRVGRWSEDATAAVDAVRGGWAERDPWFDRTDDERSSASEIGYPWDWDPIEDLFAHADQLPTVVALLASAHPAVREKAAQLGGGAAGESRSMREPMAAALTPALADPDPRVRAAAAWAVRRAGAVPEELVTLAHHDTGEAGNTALIALVERADPRARDLLPTRLTAELADALAIAGIPAHPELLDAVRQRLVALPADAPFDIDAQIARLRAGERPVSYDAERRALVELLASWGPEAAPALPELTALLTEHQAITAVAEALTAIGATAAVPALREHAANGQHRLAAATALWRLTGDPEPAVETAADLLDTDELDVIELIAELGEPARRLLPRMRERLAGEPGTSQYDQSSHLALARLVWQWTDDTAAAHAAAHAVMADGWPAPRAKAADLAAELGDPTAVDTLRTVLTEHDTWAKLLAAQALWRHTRNAEVPTLTEILTSRPNERVLQRTLDALTELGPAAQPAIPTLRTLANQDTTVVSYKADDNVAALDKAARTAIQAAITAITQEHVDG